MLELKIDYNKYKIARIIEDYSKIEEADDAISIHGIICKQIDEYQIANLTSFFDEKEMKSSVYDFYSDFMYLSGDIIDLFEFSRSNKKNFTIDWYLTNRCFKLEKLNDSIVRVNSFSSSEKKLCYSFEIDIDELEIRTNFFINDMKILVSNLFPLGYSRMKDLKYSIYR